ncbi:hypothetical protein EXIGLDRAFT_760681 [Exidia glandulosa HHB12029]|uniref:Phytanoyl-CoA dioxygenase n=1 Tax=Exidia glandulosa HHB12029 TaxID=1314781 RepID=A0A165P0G0_EXIGL|nr:hypothetical protein EXIGLDRAFT_760681 [Exidia glandulosa HHB12029]
MDSNDKTTWKERTHMPAHRYELVSSFAPKAWEAMCDLLGGEERIEPQCSAWGDSFIVNLGTEKHAKMYEDMTAKKPVTTGDDMMHPADFDNWHVDGDFFVHFLDSPEQALLAIPIFSPIELLSGGTYIGVVPTGGGFASVNASFLNWGAPLRKDEIPHLQNLNPRDDPTYMSPAPYPPAPHPERFAYDEVITHAPGMRFTELTGAVGDVILMHPLMLHSASHNWRRALRVITNLAVSLKEPFVLDRAPGEQGKYTLVEQKTLMALGAWDSGAKGLTGWKITGERRRIVPERVAAYTKREEEERKRMADWAEKTQKIQGVASVPASVSIMG